MNTTTNTTEQENLTKKPNTLLNKTVKGLKIIKLLNREMIIGTGLNGYIKASYDELEKLFDKPGFFDLSADKTRAEWLLKIGNAFIAIYDYKENRPIEEVTTWHIGGRGDTLHNISIVTGKKVFRTLDEFNVSE